VFLTLSGPSLADMNLEALRKPGVITWGVNNSPAVIRPRLWTVVDTANRFHDRLWRDPAITKFIPLPLANLRLRYKDEKGVFQNSRLRVRDCPAVWFWQRNSHFDPADFLCQSSVCWGNEEKQTDSVGVTGIRSVMLATIRLAYAVGFRTINLCGADFRMERGRPNYAFEQARDAHAVRHNNRLYAAMVKRLTALAPYFEMAGLRVFNCTPGSALEVFPFRRLSAAVAEATADCGGDLDTRDWYDDPEEPRRRVAYQWDHGGGD
jgi:hypothetical protein